MADVYMVQLPPQWRNSGRREETVLETHQLEVPFCQDDAAISIVCYAILKELCPQDRKVLIFEA